MKWLIVALFIIGMIASVLWYEATERRLTHGQRTALGIAAMAAWALVVVLSNTML